MGSASRKVRTRSADLKASSQLIQLSSNYALERKYTPQLATSNFSVFLSIKVDLPTLLPSRCNKERITQNAKTLPHGNVGAA